MPSGPESRTRRRRPHASLITADTRIWCPACRQEHPAAAFNKEGRKYSGLQGICREAQARARQTPEGRAATRRRNKRRWADPEYRKRSLSANKARQVREGQNDLRRSRARLQAIVDMWKEQGCRDCGYGEIRAIDPDHVQGCIKEGHLSRLVQLCASADRIHRELAKCVPRCARCHRRVTKLQRPAQWRARETLPPSWRRRLQMQDRNDQMKLQLGCADCGWREWARGLDWDHVRGVKTASVATMIANGRTWEVIHAEMEKCELVCANCHRIRTHERRKSGERHRAGR